MRNTPKSSFRGTYWRPDFYIQTMVHSLLQMEESLGKPRKISGARQHAALDSSKKFLLEGSLPLEYTQILHLIIMFYGPKQIGREMMRRQSPTLFTGKAPWDSLRGTPHTRSVTVSHTSASGVHGLWMETRMRIWLF